MEGVFISFEGVEGSGKSTQAAKLYEYMKLKGNDVMLIREPGGTKIGEQVRTILLDPENKGMDYYTESCLYAAARAQLVNEVIKPALEAGKIIICDRFVDSSYAYQAMARGLGFEKVSSVNAPAIENAMPHVTVFIDISPEEGLARRKNTDKFDRLDQEALAFHKKVYNGYIELVEMFADRFLTISGTGNENEVFDEMKYKLQQRLSYIEKEVIL